MPSLARGGDHHPCCRIAPFTQLRAARIGIAKPKISNMQSPRLKSARHYTLYRFCALILCFVLAAASACAQAGAKNYFPLSDGARWEYAGRFFASTGAQYPGRAIIHIEGITLIRGRRYFKYVTSSSYPNVPNAPMNREFVRYYRVEAGGIYFLLGDEPDGAERLGMPLPLRAGERWLSGAVEVTAESAGTVEAGGKKYADCLNLTSPHEGDPRTNEDYYAPGVGLVKSVYINKTPPESRSELTLESYRL